MEFDSLTYPERAAEFLARRLADGTLVLFLGAGVSVGAGLPDWPKLIRDVRSRVGLRSDRPSRSADYLQTAAEEARRAFKGTEEQFASLVRDTMYKGVQLDERVLTDRLLIALGALMMGSRRGSVRRVVTLNFDSILEWYLTLCGFVPSVIVQPPADEGAEDVRIYHPHGFLPHPQHGMSSSDFVVLGLESINLRLGRRSDEWIELLRHLLLTGVCLFVGLSEKSFRDRALGPLLASTKEALKGQRPTGFWILKSDKRNRTKLDNEFQAANIVPLHQSSYEEIPKLLLEVCRRAAGEIRVPSQRTSSAKMANSRSDKI